MIEGGFEAWPGLDDLFPVRVQGVNHNRGIDGTIIDTDLRRLRKRMKAYIEASTFQAAATVCPGLAPAPKSDGSPAIAGYDPKVVWKGLKAVGFDKDKAVAFLTFPFDQRYIYYETGTKLLNRARPEYEQNLASNEFLLTVPEPRKVSETRPLYATTLANLHVHERGSVVIPRETRGADLLSDRDANLPESSWRVLREHFGLCGDRRDPAAREFVGKLFRITLAVLHAPAYQAEHKSALAGDWAHLPVPKDAGLFSRLVTAGDKVSRLLDASRDAQDVIEAVLGAERARAIGPLHRTDGTQVRPADLKVTITYWGGGKGGWEPRPFDSATPPDAEWASVWGERTGDLYLNEKAFFAHVPEAVWTYQLGGYPVLKKWLGYRQADRRDGDPLTDEERRTFRQIIQRIAALLALGPELDHLYQDAATGAFTATELGMTV